MLITRYEEYSGHFDEALPFIFTADLKRPEKCCSEEANWHDNLEIQLFTQGNGYVLIDGERINTGEGDIVAVNSNSIHYTGTTGALEYSCLIIDYSFCKSLGIDPSVLTFKTHFKDDYIKEQMLNLKTVYRDNGDICRKARLQIIVIGILIELRTFYTVSQSSAEAPDSFETVKQAIKFIRNNYNKKLSLEKISKFVLTDKYTLSRKFKQLTKLTVVEYINKFRCQKAMGYIEEGANISGAAIMCGFSNMSFFTKTFKRYTGSLPSEIKKKSLGK